MHDITTDDVARLVDGLLAKPSAANHVFTAVRTFFRWATRRRYIRFSPCDGLQLPAKTRSRDRVLNDAELVQVWETADTIGYPFGTIVKLLILTGQRRIEIGTLRWEYIDEKGQKITLPAERTKNHREHTFPYGEMVATMLGEIPRKADWVFPAVGAINHPFSGWSPCKRRLDMKCTISHWTLHDLRRTFATNLAALKTSPHVLERILNHSSGTISGVAAIYNRFAYLDEMRAALTAWESKLSDLLNS